MIGTGFKIDTPDGPKDIHVGMYSEGQALCVFIGEPDDSGRTLISVNLRLSKYLHNRYFFAQDWNGREGIAKIALESGYFEDTGDFVETGFSQAPLWRVAGDLARAWPEILIDLAKAVGRAS